MSDKISRDESAALAAARAAWTQVPTSRHAGTVSQQRKPVNWGVWSLRRRADLRDAVALSCGIESEGFSPSEYGELPRVYHDRLKIALDHVDDGKLPIIGYKQVVDRGSVGSVPLVGLGEFKTWFEQLFREKLPNEWPSPAIEADSHEQDWPWGPHQTKLLLDLDAAARRFWTAYQPGKPSTAPKSNEVEQWLTSERGVRQKWALAIAKILRADDMPSGPHVDRPPRPRTK